MHTNHFNMRKIQFLTLLLVVAVANVALAQKTAVKIGLLSPIARTINVSAEQAISENSSIQLGFFYSGAKLPGDTKISGYGITPEFRYYLSASSAAPNGFYVAPFLRYQAFTASNNDNNVRNEGTLSSFGGGVLVGRQWIFKERVTFDMFIGPKYQDWSYKVKSGTDTFSDGSFFGNFGLRGGLTLGIAF